MSNKSVLVAFFLASVGMAAGSAWAATDASATKDDAAHATVLKDLAKLSADASQGFHDLQLTRLAIFNGDTQNAKKYVSEADAAFAKAKGDDSVFVKAETELVTADQVAEKTAPKAAREKSANSSSDTKGDAASSTAKTAWLPVDGAMSINEDYSLSPNKAKAVDEANKSLAKGDRKGAVEKLKLAEVSTSIVIEVVPRDQAVNDVHQAAQLIDSGKYYEGSQMLRNVQMAARYDVTDVVGLPKAAAKTSAASPAKPGAPAGH